MAERQCGPKGQDVIGKRYRWIAAVLIAAPIQAADRRRSHLLQHFGRIGSKL
jgi:hypothetical protein